MNFMSNRIIYHFGMKILLQSFTIVLNQFLARDHVDPSDNFQALTSMCNDCMYDT